MDLQFFLTEFQDIAGQLIEGFSSGFKINYHGPRLPVETKNFKSVLENPHIALEKNSLF
jgi:hypothetical protein